MEALAKMLSRTRWLAACAAVAAVTITAAGCSSSSSGNSSSSAVGGASGSGGSYSVTAGVLHAFTGQNAFFGLNAQNACKAAAVQVNAVGGILGHQLACQDYDTKGDPAD